jgi:ribonuclease D
VDEPEALAELGRRLAGARAVGVDTESNSLHAYREQVCLVQFSVPGMDYLVDPLALGEVAVLGEVLASPGVEKVFHAAEYDLICLRRDFGFQVQNLFDTMWAARVLGREAIGLGALLEAEFGVQVDKRHQRADWGRRPLADYLKEYARLDTHYLLGLRERLAGALAAAGRWELAVEDFRRLPKLIGRENGGEAPGSWLRIGGARELSPRQAAVLDALCQYRERVAQRRNQPLFKVLPDGGLLGVAQVCPEDVEGLRRVEGLGRRLVEQHAEGLLAAVRAGLEGPPMAMPPASRRPEEVYLRRLEALKEWRKEMGRKLGVESDVVLPRDLLLGLAERWPLTADGLGEVLEDVPWRRERFGGALLRVVNGRR